MATQLYDNNNKLIAHHDLQDKKFWCKDGESLEQSFIRQFGQKCSYVINPEKTLNPYAPDLLNVVANLRADLKVQNTPFFKAKVLYGIESTFAVVFNEKDKIRYEQNYPEIEIIYWVDWIAIKADIYGKVYTASPLKGVYRTTFKQLNNYLATLKIHYYQQRTNDTLGNAKGSYVLDIRDGIFEQLF